MEKANDIEKIAESRSLVDSELLVWKESRKSWIEKEKLKSDMLKQKSRIKWFVEGDENSKFFHSFIRRNYNKCNIRGLNVNGIWIDTPSLIKDEVCKHFELRFQETDSDRPSMEDLIYPSISQQHAEEIEAAFGEEEIRYAVFECGSSKAPGPDGFNLRFFKEFWELIKGELIEAVTWFWNRGEFSRGCNASFVTLIPKVSNPSGLNDFRPISLIGSYYKIIAKILSNRLKKCIPKLVGSEQSAFIKGRFILDGALIVNETINFLKNSKQKGLLFKVDFEKAFDCINWNFLMDVMKCMGFGDRWRKWIFACLNSASISVLVNGSPTKEFALGRGIRQGDPLSPFLFILAAEGLNILVKSALDRGLYEGIKVGRDNVTVSHLQYADDTIFVGAWNRENAHSLQNLLKCFELVSGLKVNFHKSFLYGIGVGENSIRNMAQGLNCQVGALPFTYLGLPIGANMRKSHSWNPVIDKIKARLSSWKMRKLSFGGRLVLIKSILSSLPLYFFSLFRAPASVLKLLESVRRVFFWGGSDSGPKLSWVKWVNVVCSYELGGLNIGLLKHKNLALLGKWWWRFFSEPNSLWVRIIRSIYGLYGGLELGREEIRALKPSTWRSIILTGHDIEDTGVSFVNSFVQQVGSDSAVSFWDGLWLNGNKLRCAFPRLYQLEDNKEARIKDRVEVRDKQVLFSWSWLRDPQGRTKDELDTLCSLISAYSFVDQGCSVVKWMHADGFFKVKDLCGLIETQAMDISVNNLETMRNNLVPKKIELFVWRAVQRRLPTLVELDKRGVDLHSLRCPLCDDCLESIEHTLVFCNHALDLWKRVYSWWGLGHVSNLSMAEILRGNTTTPCSRIGKRIWQAVEWVCAYLIWKNRNNKVFRGKCWNTLAAFNELQIMSFEWIANRISKKRKIEWLSWVNDPSVYLKLA
ncbi:uncharacterized protein [Rutidosis leptorrhynchoides]|uniref:uncharacterized protein n=1 Tax=Rutidosis leptorrhynchoides TaxID=125765 RepID=UPI003A996B20